jgi:hypothetical protein
MIDIDYPIFRHVNGIGNLMDKISSYRSFLLIRTALFFDAVIKVSSVIIFYDLFILLYSLLSFFVHFL